MLVDDPAVHMLRNGGPDKLSIDNSTVCTGRNSGYQTINLAVLAGARRIVLFGYDGRVGAGGRTHFHDGHPDKTHGGLYAQNFRSMVEPLAKLGVEIVNCSPGSAIDAFPRVPLDLVGWFQ